MKNILSSLIKSPFSIIFLLIFTSNLGPLVAQEIPIAKQPDWITENPIPFALIDSMGYPVKRYSERTKIYEESQINTLTKETFVKLVYKITAEEPDLVQEFELSHSPKDEERKIVSVTVWRNGKEKNVTSRINWDENESKEYVNSRLWESTRTISLYIDNIQKGDIFTVSFIDTYLRTDTKLEDGVLYPLRDSIPIYFRMLSHRALNHKTFNGFPSVEEQQVGNMREYVASGFAETPFKGLVPQSFIKIPFVCFSSFDNFDQIGRMAGRHFQTDSASNHILDELYEKLCADIENDSIKVQHILNYVQDTIIYQDYGLIRAYQPAWCIQGNRGDCKAKSLIAIELLKRAEIEAHPIMVTFPHYYEQLDEIPSYANFNHIIIQFVLDGDTIVVDPTADSQSDKIGSYPLADFRKGLVLFEDSVTWRKIPARGRGKLEIFDYISDTVSRKLRISGQLADRHRGQQGIRNVPESLFGYHIWSRMLGFNSSSSRPTIHIIDDDDAEESVIEDSLFDNIYQDSVVLFQKIFTPDSINRPFISTHRMRFWSQTTTSNVDRRFKKDSLYTGNWPLEYVNQTITATYDKVGIPLVAVDLDTFKTDFSLSTDFGNYSCLIKEDSLTIVVKQEIYIDGSLPQNRMEEYEEFKEAIIAHKRAVRNLLIAVDPDNEKKAKRGKRRKAKKRKSRS